MIALLLAAALAHASPAPGASASAPTVTFVPFASLTPEQLAKLSPMSRQALAFAGKLCQKRAVQTAGPDHAPLEKLGDLPPGLLEHAVNRIVDGCPVREIVGGAGGTYYLDMDSPTAKRVDRAAYTAPAKGR